MMKQENMFWTKVKDKVFRGENNKMEISNLPDKVQSICNKNANCTGKNWWTQWKFWHGSTEYNKNNSELKNTKTKMKNTFDCVFHTIKWIAD